MGKSAIEWTDYTWNPWIGCTKVSEGCANCYAERLAGRFGVAWGPGADIFDPAVSDAERDRVFGVIAATPSLDWLLLTKRPERASAPPATRGVEGGSAMTIKIDRLELAVGRMAMGQAFCRCDQFLETVYVEVAEIGADDHKPIATFARSADAERFCDLWNSALPECGYIIVCDCCHATISKPNDHDGLYTCRQIAQAEAAASQDEGRE